MPQEQVPFDINSLRVASPCHVGWDSMHGGDRERMCDQCGLSVYNLEGLDQTEIFDLITERRERVCVRLRRRADGTVMTRDCPRGLAAYRKRVGRLVSVAFATILGLVSYAGAQTRPVTSDSLGRRSKISIAASVIEGVVKDPAGVPIPGASVTITNGSGRKIKKTTGRTGYFRIVSANLDRGQHSIKIESPGFMSFSDTVSIRHRELLYYPVILEVGGFIGIVVVETPPRIDTRKSEISTTIRID